MTRQQADSVFANKIGEYTNYKNLVKVPLTQAQETALNSFEYNLGKNIWNGDAKPVIDKINKGDFAGAAEYLKKFNTVKGTFVQGLANRRNDEARLLTSSGTGAGTQTGGKVNESSVTRIMGRIPTQLKNVKAEAEKAEANIRNML